MCVCSAAEHLEARRILDQLMTKEEQKDVLFKGPLPKAPPDYRYSVLVPQFSKQTYKPK